MLEKSPFTNTLQGFKILIFSIIYLRNLFMFKKMRKDVVHILYVVEITGAQGAQVRDEQVLLWRGNHQLMNSVQHSIPRGSTVDLLIY